MAARLTDKQKKKIIADYLETENYRETARMNGVSNDTVKRVVSESCNIVQNLTQKKEENTKSIADYMEEQSGRVGQMVDKYMAALLDDDKIRAATPSQLTTAMGTVLDKFSVLESKKKEGADAIQTAWNNYFSSVGRAFWPLIGDIFAHGHTHYDESGGRGSMKSSFISLSVVMLVMSDENAHALVLRKVGNTMRDSVFAQYMWAIEKLGVASDWESKVSPMELIYKGKQKVMFRGADDPMKIKSIKVPFGYIAITHFEEKDQFAGRHEIRNILQSTMRGGEKFWNFESFNPPISRDNWANKDSLEERADRLTHKSTYLEAPPEWLGEQFLFEAEHLKQTDERAYQHEYLGIPVGTGGNVFENLELREITDEEYEKFDHIFMGVDWGWYPDPFAFIRLHYDRQRETIYMMDEIYENKLANEASAVMIKQRHYTDAYITCDSAEPKSVADYRALGLPAKEAIKGPGSVEYGMKFLQRRKIVIDRRRTPHAYDEFVNYEYERNKDGDIISGYPDEKNHLIDATRYALERISRRMGVTA